MERKADKSSIIQDYEMFNFPLKKLFPNESNLYIYRALDPISSAIF